MPDRDPKLMAAIEEEAKRESHERALFEIVEDLRSKGYVREGESVNLEVATSANSGTWPAKKGKPVARIVERALLNPPEDPDRLMRLGSKDPLGNALAAKGYVTDGHFDNMDADTLTQIIYVYSQN